MKNRFRFPKITVLAITVAYLVIIPFIYFQFNTNECRTPLLITACIAFLIQLFLQRFNYRSTKKIVILLTLFISASLLAGVLARVISMNAICA